MRMLLAPAVGLAVLAAGVPAPAAEESPILPGFWEARTNAFVLSSTEKKCLSTQEVLRAVHGWSNSVYTCTYPVSVVSGGRITWRGTCTSRGGRHLTITADGAYTPTSFQLTGKIRSELRGSSFTLPVTIKSRRLGDCQDFDARGRRIGG
ncbi:MAG: DUF3617 family protein [Caulobacteraceae bacterium]